jgi:hypothetical protein
MNNYLIFCSILVLSIQLAHSETPTKLTVCSAKISDGRIVDLSPLDDAKHPMY